MSFSGFLFLLITQYLSGRGLLYLFRIKLGCVVTQLLSMICGVALFSLLPFLLQLMHIPITYNSVRNIICICTLLFTCSIVFSNIEKIKNKAFLKFRSPSLPFKPYEYPFLLFFILLAVISVWHAFYFPPVPRDLLSGPEVIAEYTVREHTMINSIYSIDLHTTNNYLKPPYITCLQIIYKLFVSPFGSLWLSILFVCFTSWLYIILRDKLHPVVAAMLLLIYFAIQELYAYTYLVLFDYSSMVFFFCGFYFVARYAAEKRVNELLFAAFFFGIATYVRTETLVLVAMIVPLLAFIFYKNKLSLTKSALYLGVFVLVPAFFYYIWMNVFVKNYIPIHFDVGSQINAHLADVSPFFKRAADMSSQLIFSDKGVIFYGYFNHLFVLILIADIIFFRKLFNQEAAIALYGVGVVYFGLALLGYLIPWVDLIDTTKRGLFKMFPLMLLYMRNSGLLLTLSDKIKNWEFAVSAVVKKVVAPVKQQPAKNVVPVAARPQVKKPVATTAKQQPTPKSGTAAKKDSKK